MRTVLAMGLSGMVAIGLFGCTSDTGNNSSMRNANGNMLNTSSTNYSTTMSPTPMNTNTGGNPGNTVNTNSGTNMNTRNSNMNTNNGNTSRNGNTGRNTNGT